MFSDEGLFHYSLLSLFLITPPTILSLLFLSAPYGKHHRPGWGPTIPPPLAWCLMESPTIWLTLLLFPHGKNNRNPRALVLISPFLLHYLHHGCLNMLILSDGWFWWRLAAGAVVFVGGAVVNIWSDNLLMGLKEGDGGYKIPRGGLFEWISCPNYFGEILEWLGWALMTWSWAGFGFFAYTCANLVPRAGANHKWYLEKFGEDYPKNRKAVVPFLY
ncbi:hypothetical protein Pfo_029897 [Paulownia fortunei]|nr:hypothetical protein Pfo_029897 [Paulownia fortunei]